MSILRDVAPPVPTMAPRHELEAEAGPPRIRPASIAILVGVASPPTPPPGGYGRTSALSEELLWRGYGFGPRPDEVEP